MAISILWCGKTGVPYLAEGIQRYQRKLGQLDRIEFEELPAPRKAVELRGAEDDLYLRRLSPRTYLVLLDEGGAQYDSRAFAKWWENLLSSHSGDIVFAVGGPFGFGHKMRARANHILALSPMTFLHDMARLILLEQLYRAYTINRNMPYHY